MKVFHGKKSESNDQNHHAHSAQEHGKIEHFVGTVRRDPEIKHAEEQGKTSHTAGNEKTETPALPPEPPEADESSGQITGKEPDIECVAMRIVYTQDGGQIAGEQAGRGTEEHNHHHVEITQNGFPLEEWLQAYERMVEWNCSQRNIATSRGAMTI